MSNTHDQIYYNNNISNTGGHIQKTIQFKYVVYKTRGQIHLYLKVFRVFVFDVWELKVFVVNYFSKVYLIFSNTFTNMLSVSIFRFHCHL